MLKMVSPSVSRQLEMGKRKKKIKLSNSSVFWCVVMWNAVFLP